MVGCHGSPDRRLGVVVFWVLGAGGYYDAVDLFCFFIADVLMLRF